MEDSIALEAALAAHPDVRAALAAYQEARWIDVAKLQKTARTSQTWFEEIDRWVKDPPEMFTLNLLCRSKRVTHANLAVRDPEFVAGIDRWFARTYGQAREGASDADPVPPPMFTPFRVGQLELANRVVVSPMCMYSAEDGLVNDWHLVHLGSRAVGGAALVIAEMTDVSPEGRITPGCAGIYRDAHVPAWARIVDFVHGHSKAHIGIQLGHAGRKGSTRLPWDGENLALPRGGWETLAPSPLAYSGELRAPREMTREDLAAVRGQYVAATKRAAAAGFDFLEVHMAHGYLLATFISPLTNQRSDGYGGDLAGRLRFPLEVLAAVREAWPAERPLGVRISAVDWIPGGTTADDAVEIARALHRGGCDLIDVSSGQTAPEQQPDYGRMYQTPFADRIRHEVGMATMAVGAIADYDQVNTIVAAGRADLCALARAHLADPYLTYRAAVAQRWVTQPWPLPYRSVRPRPA